MAGWARYIPMPSSHVYEQGCSVSLDYHKNEMNQSMWNVQSPGKHAGNVQKLPGIIVKENLIGLYSWLSDKSLHINTFTHGQWPPYMKKDSL